jgi:hypothetical protein
VRSDAQVGVDLSAARLERVDRRARAAVLALPDRAESRPRVDHGRSRLFAVREDGLWAITPGGGGSRVHGLVTDRAWVEAQRTVAATAGGPEVLDRARRHAERGIGGHFAAPGWTVTIRWLGRPSRAAGSGGPFL